ncbi:MAG: hypothetical protein ACLSX5_05785 [Lachnospiraceae bacterium]
MNLSNVPALIAGYNGQLLSHKLVKPREVRGIARKSVPIHMIVHYPESEEGRRELAQRVAGVHADLVNQTIKKLICPSKQKAKLLDSIIKAANEKAGEQTF